MKHLEIKDLIVDLLEEIVKRTNYINHHHPVKDLSLDIDLVQDDLRLLYRNFETLKKLSEEQFPVNRPIERSSAEPNTPPPQEVPIPTKTQVEEKAPEAAPPAEESDTATHEPEASTHEPEAAEEESASPGSESPAPGSELPTPDSELPAPESESPAPEPIDQQPPVESTPPKNVQTIFESDAEQAKTDPPVEKPVVSPAPARVAPPATANARNKTVIDLLSDYSKKTIGDQYTGQDNSVHQRIAGNKEDKSIGARMQQNPISSIKEVIGVNEKFLFINELFDGNIQAYYDAIARLNDFENMQAAFDYLNDLGAQYSWDAGQSTATIEKLANYVQRRYM